jgi:outer membrane lipoprotein SlyB
MFSRRSRDTGFLIAPAAVCLALGLAATAVAQPRDVTHIDPGTLITVRTSETIDERAVDGRIYAGVVEEDVTDGAGRLVIPRSSPVELMVRGASDGDLILDLESVVVNGERYAVRAEATRVDAPPEQSSDGHRTAIYAGGGAILGTIVGAIAGGGKGAAIGAAAGAAAGAGAGILTHGREVRVPSETLLTFRLQRGLDMGVVDQGFDRDRHHYHRYQEER